MATAAQMLEAFGDIGYLQRGRNLLAKADPGLMRQMEAAVDAGDPMALRKLMADNIGLSDASKARMPDMPYDIKPAAPPSRDPMSFDERVARDPNINNAVSELGMQDMPAPQKLDAYRQIAEAGGGDDLIRRLGEQSFRASTPEYSLDIFNNPSVLNQDITDLFPPTASGVSDVMPGAAVPSSPRTALIPSGPRGLSAGGGGGLIVPPGRGLATTGGPRDLSVQGMGSPAPRGLPAPNRPRIEGPGQRRIEGPASRPAPRLESPDALAERRAMDDLARAVEADAPRRPPQGPPPRRPRIDDADLPPRRDLRQAAAAGGLGLAAGALGVRLAMEPAQMGDGEAGMSTADLAAETSPPPSVRTEEPAPLSPRDQAQELMRKLNLMRREAGGEVPEAPAMMREIDRLMALSNQTMAAASRGEVATGGSDYHMQAARLMAQRNEMLRRGMPTQQAQQMMAEITRLQRLGDEQRNARQAPRRAG
jgi:hypothetical protein